MEEITTVWFELKKDAFIDYSLLANGRLGWDKVEMLQPLQQPLDARGRVRLRTNMRTARKLNNSHCCLLEAIIFATGESKLTTLKWASDGASRRRPLTIADIISRQDVILVASARVDDITTGQRVSRHAIVWDGWRRLLFIGPGQFTDRELDGVLQLGENECNDPAYVDPAKGVTVAEYVYERFGISRIYDAHAIMVVHKRRSETHLV